MIAKLLETINEQSSVISKAKHKIKVAQNNILVATSEWEQVDIHIWNGTEWKLTFALRFASKTGKHRYQNYSSHYEFMHSDFYAKYIDSGIAGVDFVDVNFGG